MSKQPIRRGDHIRHKRGQLVQKVVYVRPDGQPVVRRPNGELKLITRPEWFVVVEAV